MSDWIEFDRWRTRWSGCMNIWLIDMFGILFIYVLHRSFLGHSSFMLDEFPLPVVCVLRRFPAILFQAPTSACWVGRIVRRPPKQQLLPAKGPMVPAKAWEQKFGAAKVYHVSWIYRTQHPFAVANWRFEGWDSRASKCHIYLLVTIASWLGGEPNNPTHIIYHVCFLHHPWSW